MQKLKQMRDAASLFMIILLGMIVGLLTILEGAAAKGLPPWAAISAGPKGRRLRCRRSPATIESVDRFVNPLPAAPSAILRKK